MAPSLFKKTNYAALMFDIECWYRSVNSANAALRPPKEVPFGPSAAATIATALEQLHTSNNRVRDRSLINGVAARLFAEGHYSALSAETRAKLRAPQDSVNSVVECLMDYLLTLHMEFDAEQWVTEFGIDSVQQVLAECRVDRSVEPPVVQSRGVSFYGAYAVLRSASIAVAKLKVNRALGQDGNSPKNGVRR